MMELRGLTNFGKRGAGGGGWGGDLGAFCCSLFDLGILQWGGAKWPRDVVKNESISARVPHSSSFNVIKLE